MKKYVKPLMQREGFATNEYISACYVMDCACNTNQGPILVDGISPADAVIGHFGKDTDLKFVGEIGTGTGVFAMTGTLPGCGAGLESDGHTGLGTDNIGGIDCSRYEGLGALGCWLWTLIFGDGSIEKNKAHHHVTFTDMSTIPGELHPNHS